MTTNNCCAECGKEGVVSLKACKSCLLVKYCNTKCQHKHWATHKAVCKIRATELREEALFKDPPAKEDCPICFLPMPQKLISCMSLPPATRSFVPIYNFAIAHPELGDMDMEICYPCCGKTICKGCKHSLDISGNNDRCPFCNSDRAGADRTGKTDEDIIEERRKRVEVNDAGAISQLGYDFFCGLNGLQQDQAKAIKLYTKAANFGCIQAHYFLGVVYYEGGAPKKAKFHSEVAAMAGHEVARNNLGCNEEKSRNFERAKKHWMIAASAGCYFAMHNLKIGFEKGLFSRESIDSTLVAYNSSCVEMRSEARDAYIRVRMETD